MSGLWRINVYDVETTIKGVVNKVLAKDAHSDKTKRQTAAHAIMEMGQIFQVGLLRCSMQMQRGAGKWRLGSCMLADLSSCPCHSATWDNFSSGNYWSVVGLQATGPDLAFAEGL